MDLIKRDSTVVPFNKAKIFAAVEKANHAVDSRGRISDKDIETVTANVEKRCKRLSHTPSVEEVQDMVEEELMALGAFILAKTYITYRYQRSLVRKADSDSLSRV